MILLLQYTLLFASVLLLVALGGCFSEHSGVINLGLEGIMVIGALGGALTMRYLPAGTSNFVMVLLVILASIAGGMLYSVLLAVSAINCKADQTIVGTAMNILGTAAATVIVKAINTAANPNDVSSTIQYVEPKKAFLVNIGSFEFNWFMLVAVLALVICYITLYKTRFGLRLMACGEHPQAADSVGINVYKMRYIGVLISGVLGGIGGTLKTVGGGTLEHVNGSLAPVDANGDPVDLSDKAIIGSAGTTKLYTGGLETSNVDLATEISEMITTQRGYQANTRIVTVTDSMLEELVNMKR